ncbi:centromere protein P [Rhinophrynus dorsalis]
MSHTYEDEILSLQEEIKELTKQYKENQEEAAFLSTINVKKALQSYHGKAIPGGGSSILSPNVTALLDDCEKEMKFLNELSGIELTKYLKRTEHRADNQTTCKHRLVGQCQSISFQLEFQTLDSQCKGEHSYKVTDLNVIMECREHSDLSKFVSRTEERKNLLLFFRTLSKFAECCEHRRHIFLQFKEKHPLAVDLPVGSSAEYMILRNPKLPGCELLVVWKLQIDEQGAVMPIFDLLTKIPEQALVFDKTKVIEDAPTGFRNLLRVFGIEGAIENLIQSFCLTGRDSSD